MLEWHIAPSEFWGMDSNEWWWLWNFRQSLDPDEIYAGSLSEETLEDLDGWLKEKMT